MRDGQILRVHVPLTGQVTGDGARAQVRVQIRHQLGRRRGRDSEGLDLADGAERLDVDESGDVVVDVLPLQQMGSETMYDV